jgi:hypothetical protein
MIFDFPAAAPGYANKHHTSDNQLRISKHADAGHDLLFTQPDTSGRQDKAV